MATTGTSVNSTVKDIKSELSLADGTNYALQYIGGGELRLAAAASAPAATTKNRLLVANRGEATLIIIASENIYAWTDDDFEGYVVVNPVS